MIIREVKGKLPVIGKNCFIAENASLLGEVTVGEDCSIWYGAVLRGDVGPIRLGDRVNVQDCAVLHATTDVSSVQIGNNVSIGHNATVHGAIIGDDVLIGMGAVVLDNARIPSGTIIAAGAVVLENAELEPGIWAGVPARKVKDWTPELTEKIHGNAINYLGYKGWH